jgi:predicted ATPase/class 3 adenylate cyclase
MRVPELPTGTVTFLFTDLEGSTRLWQEQADAMHEALARHDELVRTAVEARGGYIVKTTGDGAHAAFGDAVAAIAAAVDAQRALSAEPWPEATELRVRIGIHTGPAEQRDGDYYGTAVNRAARLMSVAHGGQIIVSLATEQLVRDELDGVDLVDLGEHGLRDLARPERVFQIVHPDLRAEFPPLHSLDVHPTKLPAQVTEFVGRAAELAAVSKELAQSRVVTLTGAGGVGKTRLAVQAAAMALPNFPDGAWFVDLAPIDDEQFVATEIATRIGLPEHRHGDREEALAAALARRQALVVLDNCEHLVDTVARVVDLIVRRCPAVTVLATSQEVLGIEGETTLAVRPLPEDDAQRLFVERAQAARHGFQLTRDNTIAVTELCRRLDGMPLAIELAAARVASMSPNAILERVDERFRLLGQGRRAARRRHQTLRAAVDWSYGLLEPGEQLVFDRLAVFAGEFTLEAAEAVVSDEQVDRFDVLDAVASLVAKSMVQLDDAADEDRYRLLETMRDYGLERLAERDELELTQDRHAVFYTGWAADAGPELLGPNDLVWRARIAIEYPNLRAAMTWTRDHEPAALTRIVVAMGLFWSVEGHNREGLEWITAARSADPGATGSGVAELFATAAVMAFNLARWDEGFGFVQASFERSAADGDDPRANAHLALALAALVQNRPEDVGRHSDQAIALARARGEPFELAHTLANTAIYVTMYVDDDSRGAELADEALGLARKFGNAGVLSASLDSAGMARYRTDPQQAITLLQAGFDTPGRRDHAHAAQTHFIKAVAHLSIRDDQGAAEELLVALPYTQEVGEEYYVAMELAGAAILLRRRGRSDIAARLLALLERLREEGRIMGAPRDLESQRHLDERLRRELDPEQYAALHSEGRALTLDAALVEALDALAVIATAD